MVVSHKRHHKNVRERAKQCKPDQQNPAGRDMEEENGSQPDQRDQAASQHKPHVFFVHD
jgi:hypothetical protein